MQERNAQRPETAEEQEREGGVGNVFIGHTNFLPSCQCIYEQSGFDLQIILAVGFS